MSRVRVLSVVAAFSLLVQCASATLTTRALETPNAATPIARSLANDGEFVHRPTGARAFHLPGEPLYLAAAFRLLPEFAWRYIHVPIAVLLVTCIAAAGLRLGGPALALSAGVVATLEPFVIAHGPIWDDAFLAAALEWPVYVILLYQISQPLLHDDAVSRTVSPVMARARAYLWIVVAVCAAGAGISRLQSQLILGGVAVAAVGLKRFRPIRLLGWAVVIGLSIGLGAWGLRNAAVIGHFVVGSTHDGKTLEESTGPLARHAIMRNGQAGGSSNTVVDLGNEVLTDRQLTRIALRYIATHPVEFFQTAALKVVASLLGIDLSLAVASSRNLVAGGGSLILLISGVWGLRSLKQNSTDPPAADLLVLLVAITAIVTLLLLSVGPVGLRYRLNLSAFLFIGTGAALLRATRRTTRTSEPVPV